MQCVCVFFLVSVLEKSEFKDDSQFFRFYADEEMEGTSSKSKQLQRNDFKLIENILVKSLVVSWNTDTRINSFTFMQADTPHGSSLSHNPVGSLQVLFPLEKNWM